MICVSACKHKQKELIGVRKDISIKKEHKTLPPPSASTTANSDGSLVLKQKLGLTSKEIKGSKLYSFVNEWYSVPYQYGGCLKSGVDCSCFASILYDHVYGKKLSRTAGEMFNQCSQIGYEDAKEGDLFFFKINGNKVTHVGVFLKDNYFVHASTSKGVIINTIEEVYYKKYFFCAGRLKQI